MIAIEFDPKNLDNPKLIQQWADYQSKAQKATDKVIAEWEKWLECRKKDPNIVTFFYDFNSSSNIWKEIKRLLYTEVFHGKCAYCESTLELDRYLGDTEHFRPKGRVTIENDSEKREKVIIKLNDEFELVHPGYFWLAYDWRNLLPVCSGCNSGAKADQFPADAECLLMVPLSPAEVSALYSKPLCSNCSPELYYLSPADLDQRERPLLLNPLNPPTGRDPREHLRFSLAGRVVAVDSSEIGKHSIKVLKLKREVLRKRRQKAQETAQQMYFRMCQEPHSRYGKLIKKKLGKYRLGIEEYSAAVLDYIDEIQEIQRRDFDAFMRGEN